MSLWKNSTSLILTARNGLKSSIGAKNNNYDYKILSLKRHRKTSFMPGAYVFPGGMMEPADSDLNWQSLFSSCGFNDDSFQSLLPRSFSRPAIFQTPKNEIPREVSLRITAIRETFEESGILLCKRMLDGGDKVQWAKPLPLTEIDIKIWQKKVQSKATDFYEMCKELQCYPDLWSLHEWNNWLTPTSLNKKRFDTVFFLAGMDNIPWSHYTVGEIEDLIWDSPSNILKTFEPLLPPPQHYELSRIIQFSNIDDLINFAQKRSTYGVNLHFPVTSVLKDGFVLLLPGDSKYPNAVSKTVAYFLNNEDISITKYRKTSEILNRIEVYMESNKKVVISNYKSEDGHLSPNSDFINLKENTSVIPDPKL